MSTPFTQAEQLERWLAALQERHLADLRIAEVTRALRALSSAYVERRHKVASGSTLDSRGKRAAFALYYGPMHLAAAAHVLDALDVPSAAHVLDLGCGSGTVGAAWALHGRQALVTGLDRHPWAVDEARRTYRDLAIDGRARVADISRIASDRAAAGADAVVCGYVLNEIPGEARSRVEAWLVERAAAGAAVLVLEPIARAVAPWWNGTADAFVRIGGRADEWRFAPVLPDIVTTLGQAAGLSVREVRLRSIYVPARQRRA